jgi:hypothetical protein
MEKITIELELKNDIKNTAKNVQKLNEGFQDTQEEVKNIGKSTKNAEGGIKALSAGFKGMGLAVKALGIGLVMEAFNMFKEVLSKNQKVVDIMNTALEALSIVFNDLIKIIFDNFPKVIEFFKDVFEHPVENLKKLGNAIKENLIERFNSFLDTLGYLTGALKNLFAGEFSAALDSLKKAGKESVDVLTGVNNSVDKGADLIEKGAKALTKYGKKVLDSAQALIDLKNASQLAAAQQAKDAEKFDREAEKQRQIRDNDLLSIDKRIEANNELNDVLDKQAKAMNAAADAQVAAAQAEVDKNDSIENQVALINAQANAAGVLAQVEGLRSEQQANAVALTKEKIDLDKTAKEGVVDLSIAEKQATAELLKDEDKKLKAQLDNLEEEKKIQLERLQNNINSYALGTQARVDAEKEFNAKKQELDASIKSKEDEIATYNYTKQSERLQAELSNEQNSLSMRLESLRKYNELAQKSNQLSAEEKAKIDKEAHAQEKALQKQKVAMAMQTFSNIGSLFEQSSTEGKAFAVASALINTYQGITAELATKTVTPFEFGIKLANIATTAAIGFKSVNDILSTNVGGGGTADTSAPSATATQAPSFNVVGNSGINQIAQTLGKEQAPLKAYVVAQDVTTQQALNRNIVTSASLG